MLIPTYIQCLSVYASLSELSGIVSTINTLSRLPDTSDNAITDLRKPLLDLLTQLSELPHAPTSLFGRLYHYGIGWFHEAAPPNTISRLAQLERDRLRAMVVNALGELAYAFPLNDEDPIDLESLSDDTPRFVSITGLHYRLSTMAEWIAYKKAFIYPNYCKKMYPEDIERFKAQCLREGVSFAPLNENQIALNRQCEALGLSQEDLSKLQVPQLRMNHLRVIEKLISEKGYTIETAIDELQGLNYEQAEALLTYFDIGLRGNHLRDLIIDESEYGPLHTAMLDHLMKNYGMNIEQAIATISPYGFDEVENLYYIEPRLTA